MGDMVQTPDGEVYHVSELDDGRECVRCSAFIPVRADLPPKPDTADYSELRVEGYAGTENRVIGNSVSGDLCPECRDEFDEWLQDGGDA